MKKKKPSLAEIVSRNIRKARLEAGMTQKELADKAGFKVSYVARLETRPQNLSLNAMDRISKGLGIKSSQLLTEGSTRNFSRTRLDFKEAMKVLNRLEVHLFK